MKRALITLVLLLLLLVGFAGFLAGSEAGLNLILWQIRVWAPNNLHIESGDGSIIGPLKLKGIKFQTEDLTANIDSIELNWTPSSLSRAILEINFLYIKGVHYQAAGIPKVEEETGSEPGFVLPERLPVPISLELHDLQITTVSLRPSPGEDPIIIDSLSLTIDYSSTENALRTALLAVNSSILSATADLSATTAGQYPFKGKLDWILRLPEFSEMQGSANLSGTSKEITIEPTLASPYSSSVLLQIKEPLTALSFAARVTIAITDTSAIRSDLPPIGMKGEITFRGSPADIHAHSSINLSGVIPQEIRTQLTARLHDQLVTLDNAQLTLENNPVQLTTKGTVNLSGPLPETDITLNWSEFGWPLDSEAELVSRRGSARLKGTPEDIDMTLTADIGETGKFNASGALAGQAIETAVNWDNLQWPADGAQVSGLSGSLNLKGQLDDYIFSLSTRANTPQLQNIRLAAKGQGTQQHMRLPTLELQVMDGVIKGNAELAWAPALSFAVNMKGEELNLTRLSVGLTEELAAELPENLQFAVNASGNQTPQALAVQLDELNVKGIFRKIPFLLKAQAKSLISETKDARVTVDELLLESGPTRLTAQGTVGDSLDLQWSLDSPDLATLWPGAGGSVAGRGELHGTSQAPAFAMDLRADSLAYQEYSVKSLKIQTKLESAGRGKVALLLKLSDSQLPGLLISDLSVNGNGQLDEHQLTISGRTNQGDIDLNIFGSLVDQTWAYQLNSATLTYPQLAPWTLNGMATGEISADSQKLDRACFHSGGASFCVSGQKTSDELMANYQLTDFALDYLRPFIPEGIHLAGVLNSKGSLTQKPARDPLADISLLLTNGTLDVDGPKDAPVRIMTLQPTTLNARLNDTGLQFDALLDLGPQGKIDAQLAINGEWESLRRGKLSGQIVGGIDDISFIEALAPDLERLKGRLDASIGLHGTAEKPVITGSLELKDGALELYAPGLSLERITAALSAKGGSQLAVTAKAHSGEGALEMAGAIDLATSPLSVAMTLTGDRFQAVNTPEAQAAISPVLDISFKGNELQVNGTVRVPKLHITPKKIPSGTVKVSADQTFADADIKDESSSPLAIRALVRIIMGDDILIDAFGLRTGLSGELSIAEIPGNETTATGQLDTVGGTFKAYGQNLKIRRGRIIYVGGPVTKPGFDIEAVREVTTDLSVGVRARGALAKPQFSLFSDPTMPESQQMSYLVFGRPLEGNSPGENSAVRQAAMALGVAGGSLLTETFGDELGLDEIKIDSELRETGEQASLVVGKYLSPKLFVSYGVGLFEPVSTLRLNYSVNKIVKLVTETTESESGGDIVFTFEGGERK